MPQTLHYLKAESLAFPAPELALKDPNGLLAIGGDLSPERLIAAYSQGIFPWFNVDDPIIWWCPSPRAVIPVKDIRINRTLAKCIKKHYFQVTLNQDFNQVIEQCAHAPFRKQGTWIVDDMIEAYKKLHLLGYAHSIEVWLNNQLVGGLYGVAINGYFSGESMFYCHSNASKVALVTLAKLLASIDVEYIDCQISNTFLQDMGCIDVNRKQFVELQQNAITKVPPIDFWQQRMLDMV
mgnify:CR=1 FL=1